jgi:hypothetical protein
MTIRFMSVTLWGSPGGFNASFLHPSTSDDRRPTFGWSHLFEYACHEGNYAMKNILSGARATER